MINPCYDDEQKSKLRLWLGLKSEDQCENLSFSMSEEIGICF